jgi:hypothetical protein
MSEDKKISNDLSLVSFDDLIAELHKRFDIFIFSGMQFRKIGSEELHTVRRWAGNKATCAGLASQLQIALYDTQCAEAHDGEEGKTFEK